MAERTCAQCGVRLAPDAHRQRLYCGKSCKWRADRARMGDGRRAYFEAYREDNREKAKAYAKAYRKANPDIVRLRNRAWYEANRERAIEANRRWRDENPSAFADQVRQTQAVRRIRKVAGDVRRVSRADWVALCRRFGGCCAYCGREAKLTMDHVVPLCRGGRHALGNILPACAWCNASKGRLLLVEWRKKGRAVEAFEAG